MSEFPRAELLAYAEAMERSASRMFANLGASVAARAAMIRQAVKSHDELQERCVMDATEASLHIANLRARLAQVDPEWKA